jgi:hypothetical protein
MYMDYFGAYQGVASYLGYFGLLYYLKPNKVFFKLPRVGRGLLKGYLRYLKITLAT